MSARFATCVVGSAVEVVEVAQSIILPWTTTWGMNSGRRTSSKQIGYITHAL